MSKPTYDALNSVIKSGWKGKTTNQYRKHIIKHVKDEEERLAKIKAKNSI